ncbi:MAG TPA: hypothetical protein PLY87_18925, partial [Planctomycetaceae bacterium]|nr:hypothetical protein [Planctomycetaceae bacterium]
MLVVLKGAVLTIVTVLTSNYNEHGGCGDSVTADSAGGTVPGSLVPDCPWATGSDRKCQRTLSVECGHAAKLRLNHNCACLPHPGDAGFQ